MSEIIYIGRNRDGIAHINGQGNYSSLAGWQQTMVDDVFYNLMSYSEKENVLTRLTEGQLDRWADAANTFRHQAVDGYSRFVSTTGNDIKMIGYPFPNDGLGPATPARTVTHTVSMAGLTPGDTEMIVIQPGNYNEQGTFNQACTLRATRNGPAVIGKP